MTYLLLLAGLALLFVGGEALVRGSVAVARRLGLSELVIGLTLVGFGTSVPELVTSLRAVGTDAVGVAVGNVAGSNIANVLLILGLSAVVSPLVTNPRALRRDMSIMLAVTALLILLIWFDGFTRLVGIALVTALIVYVVGSVWLDRRGSAAQGLHEDEASALTSPYGLLTGFAIAAVGIAGVILGANLLVDNSVKLARAVGISEAVIGLTIVAVGTSLPELATSVVAAFRHKTDVAVGNVIGSNIFNVLGILGITAVVKPFSVSSPVGGGASMFTFGDFGMLVLSAFLLVLFAWTGARVARWEGAVLLAAYVAYMAFLFGMGS